MTSPILQTSLLSLSLAAVSPVFSQDIVDLTAQSSQKVSYLLYPTPSWEEVHSEPLSRIGIQSSSWKRRAVIYSPKTLPLYEEYRGNHTQLRQPRWPGITAKISEDLTFVIGRSHTSVKLGFEMKLSESVQSRETLAFGFWKTQGRIDSHFWSRASYKVEYRKGF